LEKLGLYIAFDTSSKRGKDNGRPKNNQLQNKQTDIAVDRYNLSKEGRLALHNYLHNLEYPDYHDVMEAAKEIQSWGGKYVK
jgi:hypothetical protein